MILQSKQTLITVVVSDIDDLLTKMADLNMAWQPHSPTLHVSMLKKKKKKKTECLWKRSFLSHTKRGLYLHVSLAVRHPRVDIQSADALGCGHEYHPPAQGCRYAYS